MTPFRWRILNWGVPAYVAVMLLPAPIGIGLLAAGNDAGLIVCYAWFGWLIAVNIAALVLLALATRVDVKNELARYHYLFEAPKTLSDEPLVIPDGEFTYTLTSECARLELPPIEGEQVFDEAQENVFHIPWRRAELALATQSEYRHVYIALAVFPPEMDEDLIPFFIPITEDAFAFIKKMGFDSKLGGDWDYLFYHPEDAFKQLVLKGRILTMRNKKTGKLFLGEDGNFLGDE